MPPSVVLSSGGILAEMEASASVMARIPDFYIVGAPKCGTTSMYEYLRQHPSIFMPFHKEPLYFGSDLTHRYGRLTRAEYERLFVDAEPHQRVGEASAWSLYSTKAASEICESAPSAQIIVMLRNPVDVMHAQHSQLLFNRQENIIDFSEALEAEEDRVGGRNLPPGPLRVENLFYRRMVCFGDQLQRYFDVFGRDRVHVILNDDLRADTPSAYRATLEFLGVDESFAADFDPANENKRVRIGWIQRLIWHPPFVRQVVPILRRIPAVHSLRTRLLDLNSERTARATMDPALRRRLTEEFTPDVLSLGRLIGRDLSHWTRSS
jgi:hypothetical protein